MTKVCLVNPTTLMKRPIAEIAKRLEGYEVTICTPRKLFNKRDNSLHYSDLHSVRVITYPTISLPGDSEWAIPGPGFLWQAWKVLRDHDVVQMWVPFYLSTTTIALMKRWFDTKLILTMDTVPGYSFSMGSMDTLFKWYYATIGKKVFRAVDVVTLYCRSMIPYAQKAGIPGRKVAVTPTGIDPGVKKEDKDVRREFGITGKMALFVGLQVHRKGIDRLITIAKHLPDVQFVIVGDGPGRKDYEQEVKRRHLNNVIFTGFRKDVHNFYQTADVFVFPSRGEGLAGVLMEAMKYELPVVASDIPGNRDLIQNGQNGFLCKRLSDYWKKIAYVLEHPDRAEMLGSAARTWIEKKYNWERNLQGFKRLYQ